MEQGFVQGVAAKWHLFLVGITVEHSEPCRQCAVQTAMILIQPEVQQL